MQLAVRKLIELGSLPNSGDLKEADLDLINRLEQLITSIKEPVTNEEANELCKLFGPDECFGLAWSLLHKIETAPNWSIASCHVDLNNEWIERLKERKDNLTRGS